MTLNLEKELQALRHELIVCFREMLLSKQFQATLTLAMISLHLLVARAQQTRDLEERRKLSDEFIRASESIRRGIELLRGRTTHRLKSTPISSRRRVWPTSTKRTG